MAWYVGLNEQTMVGNRDQRRSREVERGVEYYSTITMGTNTNNEGHVCFLKCCSALEILLDLECVSFIGAIRFLVEDSIAFVDVTDILILIECSAS